MLYQNFKNSSKPGLSHLPCRIMSHHSARCILNNAHNVTFSLCHLSHFRILSHRILTSASAISVINLSDQPCYTSTTQKTRASQKQSLIFGMLPCHGRKSGLSVETRIAFQVFISNSEKCKTCSRIFCVKIISQKLFGIRFFFLREINLTEILCIETNLAGTSKSAG